jgi:hypothetical protein
MSAEKRRELRRLEGGNVHLALTDGSRIDDVQLVSARGLTLWIFASGEDQFVPVSKVVDVWSSNRMGSAA